VMGYYLVIWMEELVMVVGLELEGSGFARRMVAVGQVVVVSRGQPRVDL